jgi:Toprim domain
MSALDPRTLARALGGDVTGRNSVSVPGPGHSPGDRSLAIQIAPSAPDGFICHSHAGDDWQLCRDYVREKLGMQKWQPGDGIERVFLDPPSRRHNDDDHERIARATKIWNEARDPKHTVVEDYLRSRSLELPDELAGAVLRYHPRCPWRDAHTTIRIPALIAAFRSIDNDTITGIHRIRLDEPSRWPKADRRMLGIVRGAAVKLDPINSKKLCIGEGIETCMAARQMGLTPAWALGSAGGISFFPVIPGIRTLTILGEPDIANAEAQRLCTRRWRHAYRTVLIATSEVGGDMNDALMMGVK